MFIFQILVIAIAFLSNALAYHDPDLNYHLSQLNKVQNCDHAGYSYPPPKVQLSLGNVKATAAPNLLQSLSLSASNEQKSSNGYSQSVFFKSEAPQIAYQTYQAPVVIQDVAALNAEYSSQKEEHGYATSTGLSATTRTVIPQATYAQAPIISKITAAPLQAKFSIAPAKTFFSQNSLSQQSAFSSGSAAKASLHSYTQSVGPVVSQVYAAPSTGYSTSPALKVQSAQYAAPTYSFVNQYSQASSGNVAPSYKAPSVSQYVSSSVSHISAPAVQYRTPVLSQHSAPISYYSAPSVQYSAPTVVQHNAPVVAHYSAPAIAQYSGSAVSQHSQLSSSNLRHYSVPIASPQVSRVPVAIASTASSHSLSAHAAKNIHAEFVENYVSSSLPFFILFFYYLLIYILLIA